MRSNTLKSLFTFFIIITTIGFIFIKTNKNPKKILTQQQEQHIFKCNKEGIYSDCEKISRVNRNKIKNQSFIKSRKIEALISLEKCTISLDKIHCQELANEISQDKKEMSKISWLGRDITKKEYKIIFNVSDKKFNKKSAEAGDLENIDKDDDKNVIEEEEVLDILKLCKNVIIGNLKIPESYKEINSESSQIRTGSIGYSYTNNLNKRAEMAYKCFDP